MTITIMRHEWLEDLFRRLTEGDALEKDDIPGKYKVGGYTDIPLHIVIMSELEGDENAMFSVIDALI